MATPIIRSTGSVSGVVTGTGRDDLDIGEEVACVDVEPANAGMSYTWELVDKPLGSTTELINATSPTVTFTPDVTGSYWLRCTIDFLNKADVILAVPLPNTGARIPAFGEELQYDGGGNDKGWHEALTVFVRQADANLGATVASRDNYAAVRTMAANEPRVGQDVYVRGGSTAGDGGEGILHWDPTCVLDDDGATIFKVTSILTGRFRRKYKREIELGWFLPAYGGDSQPGVDPVANRNKIQKAIDLAASTRCKLIAHPGVYMVYPKLNVVGVTIEGAGVQWASTPGVCFRLQVPNGQAAPDSVVDFAGRVDIKDVWFDGSFVAKNTATAHYQTTDSTWQRVFFTGALPLTENKQTFTVTGVTNTNPIEITTDAPTGTFTIASATGSNPVTVETTTPHNYTTGNRVRVVDNTAAVGVWLIDVIDSMHFNLRFARSANGTVNGGTVSRINLISAEYVTISNVGGKAAANGYFQITEGSAPNKFTINVDGTGGGSYTSGGTVVSDPDPNYGNLFTTVEDDTLQVDALTFRNCGFIQDINGAGGDDRTKRGSACVNNYHPYRNVLSNPQALLWKFEGNCVFSGQSYGFRSGQQGQAFIDDCAMFDMKNALVWLDAGGVVIHRLYSEPGQPQGHYTTPKFIDARSGGSVAMYDSQCNIPGASVESDGRPQMTLMNNGLPNHINLTPSLAQGAIYKPHLFINNRHPSGHGITYPSAPEYATANYNMQKMVTNIVGSTGENGLVNNTLLPNGVVFGDVVGARTMLDKNSSGAVWITAPATEATVTFAQPEADANYHILPGVCMPAHPEETPNAYYRAATQNGFIIGYNGTVTPGRVIQINWLKTYTF